jgi:hypothetical protein
LLAWLWRRLFGIQLGRFEGSALTGAVIALVVVSGLLQTWPSAVFVGGLVILGYFIVRLIGTWGGSNHGADWPQRQVSLQPTMKTIGTFVIAVAVLLGIAQVLLLDGFDGELFSLVAKQDTQYSFRYSDAAFRRISVGMTPDDVIKLLGRPLIDEHHDDGTEAWAFTRSPSDASYHVRSILFEHGRVKSVHHEFYVD